MPSVFDAGEIGVKGNVIFWILSDFLERYPLEVVQSNRREFIQSKSFSHLDKRWYLCLYTNGQLDGEDDWLGIGLFNCTDKTQFLVRVGLVGENRQECLSTNAECRRNSYVAYKVIRRSVFEFRKNDLLPGGNLEIFCEIRPLEGEGVWSWWQKKFNRAVAVQEAGKSELEDHNSVDESTQTDDDFCLNEPENAKPNNESNSEKPKPVLTESFGKLQDDLEKLFLTAANSDIILKVQEKEFRAHRLILSTRSSVFSAMMEHDMKEKSTGVVPIEDLNPDTFSDFLHYLYTGSEDKVTLHNALDLYTAADKYQVEELKRVCLKVMMSTICTENFCDVLVLSLRHQEREVTEMATQFFLRNAREIVLTTEWQTLITKNPIVGNELFIKHLARQ